MKDDETLALKKEVARLRKTIAVLTPDLDTLLRRKGFKIYKKEPSGDLLLPAPEHIDGYYGMLHKYSFRLFLRDVIKVQNRFTRKDVTRYATAEVTGDFMDFMLDIGLIEQTEGAYRLRKRPVKSFGATLEWFLAEIFKREFLTETAWGVKFKRPRVGGDYDLIAKINGSILYMEVKSSPPKQIYHNEISAFFDRVVDLAAEPAVFFMDTELRMKDKIVPMFESELKSRYLSPIPIVRMERELFQIMDKTFIINSKGGITENMEKALVWYFRRKT